MVLPFTAFSYYAEQALVAFFSRMKVHQSNFLEAETNETGAAKSQRSMSISR